MEIKVEKIEKFVNGVGEKPKYLVSLSHDCAAWLTYIELRDLQIKVQKILEMNDIPAPQRHKYM